MRNGLSQRIALEVYIRNSQSTRLRLVDSESRMYTSSAILLYRATSEFSSKSLTVDGYFFASLVKDYDNPFVDY